jgi:hypothetical protein
MPMMPQPADDDPDIEVRCQPGRPCDDYRHTMQASARLRAQHDEPAAQVLIAEARWHRLLCLHPELEELDR